MKYLIVFALFLVSQFHVSSANLDARTTTNALIQRRPWSSDYIFYDDFSRTNIIGSTNLGRAISGQPYGSYMGTEPLWYTNLWCTNGFLKVDYNRHNAN